MLLNLDIIKEHLPEGYPAMRYGPRQRSLCCRRPVLYEQGKPMEEDVLYVARSASLPQRPPRSRCGVICVGQRLPQSWSMQTLPALLVRGDFSAVQVLALVNAIFDDFDQWEEGLRDALEREEDFRLEELLRIGAGKLPYQLSVCDSGLSTLCTAEPVRREDGTMEICLIDQALPMPMDCSEQILQVCNMERTIRTPYLTAVNLAGKSYCNNFYLADHFVGCGAVGIHEGDFREGDYPLMDRFFTILRQGYIKHLRFSTQREKPGLAVLQKLLDGQSVCEGELERLQDGEGSQWYVFVLRERLEEQSYPREYMRASLNALSLTGVYAVVHRESLTGLLRVEPQEEAGRIRQFSDLVCRMGYQCGLSNPFTLLRQLDTYLPQAAFSVTKAQELGLTLCPFHRCALDYLLESCLGDMTTEAVLCPGLRRLQAHDQTRGTQYIQTLTVYLRNEMSIVHTAQALYIHRSSLLKRLDKIQRLLEDNLENPRNRLYYRLCLELLTPTPGQS